MRRGLLIPGGRRRDRSDYRRWQRDEAMQLWQLDIMGGVWLHGDAEVKVVTGLDDASRHCVLDKVVLRATSRAVCAAFVDAMRRYGVPDEVLTDNGKQFTDRFNKPRPGEALFEKICRDNGITTRLTAPASPTTTGKIERFHQTLRQEFLNHQPPFVAHVIADNRIIRTLPSPATGAERGRLRGARVPSGPLVSSWPALLNFSAARARLSAPPPQSV